MQLDEEPGAKSPFSILPQSGDQTTMWACSAWRWDNPTLQSSTATRTYSIHKTSTLCRILSVCIALSSTPHPHPGPSRCGSPSREHVGKEVCESSQHSTQQQLAHGLLSPWELRVTHTQHSCSVCDSVQTKDRTSHTPAQSAEPDLGFTSIYPCCPRCRPA